MPQNFGIRQVAFIDLGVSNNYLLEIKPNLT